jgi:hypothetical protein
MFTRKILKVSRIASFLAGNIGYDNVTYHNHNFFASRHFESTPPASMPISMISSRKRHKSAGQLAAES